MVEFRIKIHPKQRLAYIPQELFELLGSEVYAIPNRKGVFLFPKGVDPRLVLESLRIIERDLELNLSEWKKKRG